MDFLRDTLLWAKLIDKYKGTMAPNFAYALLAKRLRRQAQPGQFDLSTLRWERSRPSWPGAAMRPRNVVVLGPGAIPKTPSGKLRRAHSVSLISS